MSEFDPSLRKFMLNVSTPCIELYFESSMKFLGPTLFHLSSFEGLLGYRIRYKHMTWCSKFQIDLCNSSLVHPSL